MSHASQTQGAHHIGLTVPNVQKARDFFVDTLGFEQVAEKPDYPAIFVSDGTTMITLWQVVDPGATAPFDRKNVVGLHHFALKVDDADALDAFHEKLKVADDVVIEFSPESIGGGATRHMMFAILGGIRMELIAPAS
jgi:catechol 2,3-dioxygenase-like lactoylglutathione lyase family enzyme